jgi:hypothetical protein
MPTRTSDSGNASAIDAVASVEPFSTTINRRLAALAQSLDDRLHR